MVKKLSEALNVALLQHDLYNANEDRMREFEKVIMCAKKNKIPIVKFSDLQVSSYSPPGIPAED